MLLPLLPLAAVMAAVGPLPANDAELNAAVRLALSRDPALGRAGIAVSAAGGHVRLEGGVPTLAAVRRAERIAASQRGVLGLAVDLTITSAGVADRTVESRLWNHLAVYSDLRPPGLRLEVEGGLVRGEGTVETAGRRIFLDGLIAGVEGVQGTDLSAVRVEAFSDDAGDDLIRDRIRSLLHPAVGFPVAGRIDVACLEGAVTLTGTVPRLIDRIEAVRVAGLVPGVRTVSAEVEIDPQMGRLRRRQAGDPH